MRNAEQIESPNRRGEGPTNLVSVEIPEPKHEAEVREDASANTTTMAAGPVLPIRVKEAMPTTEIGGPSRVRQIKHTIRRSNE